MKPQKKRVLKGTDKHCCPGAEVSETLNWAYVLSLMDLRSYSLSFDVYCLLLPLSVSFLLFFQPLSVILHHFRTPPFLSTALAVHLIFIGSVGQTEQQLIFKLESLEAESCLSQRRQQFNIFFLPSSHLSSHSHSVLFLFNDISPSSTITLQKHCNPSPPSLQISFVSGQENWCWLPQQQ